MGKIGKISFFLLFVCCLHVTAQKTGMQSSAMSLGENSVYEAYFKWGLIMSRAGEASFSYDRDHSVSGASSCYSLHFRTTKFFDNFFKMRDTISAYYDNDNRLVYSIKKSDEGDYYSVDELKFKSEEENTKIHSRRYASSRIKIDTTLTVTGDVTDLLGVVYYLRGINRNKLRHGDTFPLTAAIGRDLVKMRFIYQNQSVVDRGNVKYNTCYFKIDIFDEAFESASASAEVWIGDDDNFLPIKVRAKLKIGYAEIYYKNSSNPAHPLKCRIEIKK
ncbi:MAG: DUF3108 domain-containing protein [Tannerella sp.]|jgi:hypothetical protein|nr:DUF3108 domain-containing protein [Tannerella sp.]